FNPLYRSIDYEYQNNHYSVRLYTLLVRSSESLTIRILPQSKRYTLNELCLFPFQTIEISKLLNFTSGLIVFSGSTGSGKTTLMYSLIEELLKQKSAQIITLEDPVESTFEDVIQIQINEIANIN